MAITGLALATILAAYLTALRLAVETAPNRNDGLYFGLHGLALSLAIIAGGVVGYLNGRRAFAIAVLFLAVMLIWMFAAQYASFEMACSGHNDIIRHWQC